MNYRHPLQNTPFLLWKESVRSAAVKLGADSRHVGDVMEERTETAASRAFLMFDLGETVDGAAAHIAGFAKLRAKVVVADGDLEFAMRLAGWR